MYVLYMHHLHTRLYAEVARQSLFYAKLTQLLLLCAGPPKLTCLHNLRSQRRSFGGQYHSLVTKMPLTVIKTVGWWRMTSMLFVALLAVAFWAPPSRAQPQSSSNPTALWTFDECKGQTAEDSVSGFKGTLSAGAQYQMCPGTSGISCTLATSSAKCNAKMPTTPGATPCDDSAKGSVMTVWPIPDPINFDGQKEFTVSAWVYAKSYGTAPSVIVARHYGGNQFALMMGRFGTYDLASATFFVAFKCKAVRGHGCKGQEYGVQFQVQGSTIYPRTWTHVAGAFTPGWVKVYINGTRVGKTRITAPYAKAGVNPTTERFYIAGHPSWNPFNGNLDCIGLYDTGLNDAQNKQQF